MSDPVIMPVSEDETTEIALRDQAIVKIDNLDIEQVKERADLIQELLKSVMIDGEHYGKIPGVSKNILFKAGAEKIGMVFRINPTYEVKQINYDNFHREIQVTCTLTHVNGVFVGQGLGSCSTLESKYRYRNEQRVCPACGVAAIIPGKKEFGGGWLCWKKKDGCGAKFDDNDDTITGQQVGKVENPDIADLWNTVLKMAKKRAHVDAIITATGASDIFTQDLEPPANTSEYQPKAKPPANPGVRKRKALYMEIQRELIFAQTYGNYVFDEETRSRYKAKLSSIKGSLEDMEAFKVELEKQIQPEIEVPF